MWTTNTASIDLIVFLKGFCYLTGFFDDAKRDFQQALKLSPDFEDAQVSLQQTLLDQQEKIIKGYWWIYKYCTSSGSSGVQRST